MSNSQPNGGPNGPNQGDTWNNWEDDWNSKPSKPANRLEAKKSMPAPYVYTPPSQPACTAPLPSSSAHGAPVTPAAQPNHYAPPSRAPLTPVPPSMPVPTIPTHERPTPPLDYGDWSEQPVQAAQPSWHQTQTRAAQQAPAQQQHAQPSQIAQQQHVGGGEPNGGIAAALSGAIGQGLAANVMPAGMNGTSGGDAMQQMAAGVAMNYLGGIKNYGEQTAVTYTGSTLAVLRYYFQVDNAYVLRKLRVLALPYRHPEWERKPINGDAHGQMQPPKMDVNAPDLYLPLMAFITYILLVGFVAGADAKFTPELLGMTASSGIVLMVLEVTAIKFTFYLLQGSRATFLDLLSCCGYKFLSLVLTLLFRLTLGTTAGYLVMTASSASVGTFIVKTLRQCFADSNGFTPGFMTEGIGSPGKKERRKLQSYSLIAVGVLQLPIAWYLCRV